MVDLAPAKPVGRRLKLAVARLRRLRPPAWRRSWGRLAWLGVAGLALLALALLFARLSARFWAGPPAAEVIAPTDRPATMPAQLQESSTRPLILTPVADAYVMADAPQANRGTAGSLRVDGHPAVHAYLLFDFHAVVGTVQQASLRLFANSGSSVGYRVHAVAGTGWEESTLTYENAPPWGGDAGSSGPFAAGTWTEVDVTSLVQAGGWLALALTTPGETNISLASREEQAHAPQLRLVLGPPALADAGQSPSPVPTVLVATSSPAPTLPPASAATPVPSPPATTLPATTLPATTLPATTPPATTPPATTPPAATLPATTPPATTPLPQTPRLGQEGMPLTFAAWDVADGTLELANPENIQGSGGQLELAAEPAQVALLRFVVPPFAGERQRVSLQLYATAPTAGIVVRRLDGAWSEEGPLAGTFPAPGSIVARSGPVAAEQWLEVDVSAAISGPGEVNLALASEEGSARFHSREAGATAPRLVFLSLVQDGGDPVLVGAGDVAACNSDGDETTAALLDTIPGYIFVAGDVAYESGTAGQFATCYHPSWGRHLARTFAVPGNHDYKTEAAAGYYAYFGARPGQTDAGTYSFDLGAWHIIALNSNCARAGGCAAGSPQYQWLEQELAAHPDGCALAFWHHPRWSSGRHGAFESMDDLWRLLAEKGVELVLSGHDHNYERFAPLDAAGMVDRENGLRQFVVGTGGKSHRPVNRALPGSEVTNDDAFGLLKLTLHAGSYDWQFMPEPDRPFTDSGSTACH